ncbi:hypothetical protein FGB62_4g056 [Gracilaria domingensis]|nr:hypothetical protein FGB62_4g056 [Gracilaria domingensis]
MRVFAVHGGAVRALRRAFASSWNCNQTRGFPTRANAATVGLLLFSSPQTHEVKSTSITDKDVFRKEVSPYSRFSGVSSPQDVGNVSPWGEHVRFEPVRSGRSRAVGQSPFLHVLRYGRSGVVTSKPVLSAADTQSLPKPGSKRSRGRDTLAVRLPLPEAENVRTGLGLRHFNAGICVSIHSDGRSRAARVCGEDRLRGARGRGAFCKRLVPAGARQIGAGTEAALAARQVVTVALSVQSDARLEWKGERMTISRARALVTCFRFGFGCSSSRHSPCAPSILLLIRHGERAAAPLAAAFCAWSMLLSTDTAAVFLHGRSFSQHTFVPVRAPVDPSNSPPSADVL